MKARKTLIITAFVAVLFSCGPRKKAAAPVNQTRDFPMAEIPMMITASCHARLVSYAKVVSEIVFPKAVFCNMTGLRILVVLDICIRKIFPRIMIPYFMLIGKCGIKTSLIECSKAKIQMVHISSPLS